MNTIKTPAVPNMPLGPEEYEQAHHTAFANTLRLFFNLLVSALSTLTGRYGGQYINNPYGAFQNDSDVTLAAADTATLVPINTTDYANGMSFASGDGIHVSVSGLYNYQFSIQFTNSDTSIHTADVWLRKNGVDVTGTASKFDIIAKHGGINGYVIGACNFYVDLAANDYVELWWAADSTQVFMESAAAQTSPFARPSIPSVVATLTFVSSY